MHRAGIEIPCAGGLDDPAEIHHGDPVRDVAHHGEVVGDEQEGQAEALLELLQQIEHAGLHRDVQGRDRLVEHHDLGLKGQGARDPHTLALAAGKLVGKAPGMLLVELHDVEQLAHSRRRPRGRTWWRGAAARR